MSMVPFTSSYVASLRRCVSKKLVSKEIFKKGYPPLQKGSRGD